MNMTNQMKRLKLLLAALVLALGASACGGDEGPDDDHGDDHPEQALVDHACEHAQNGPFVPDDGTALEAGAGPDDELPMIHVEQWTTIALSDEDGDGTYEGFVRFEPQESGDHAFFSSAPWPGEEATSSDDPYLLVTGEAGGEEPTFHHKEPIGEEPGCVEIAFGHLYEGLVSGESYVVEITEHPESQISIVAELAEDDHDH